MKKLLSLIIVFATILSLGILFNSCGKSDGAESAITFGEKYTYISELKDDWGHLKRMDSYIFNKNGTGEFYLYHKCESSVQPENNYTISATIKFRWDMSYDGALFLFEDEVIYNDDNTADETVSLSKAPFSVSKNVLFPVTTGSVKYVREGSDLFDLNNDINIEE